MGFHVFDDDHAISYGPECAILINHFRNWIEHNQRLGRNFIEGRTWSYQSQESMAAYLPFWNRDQIQYLLDKLEKFGIIRKGNFNKNKFDKTTWYSFENEKMFTKVEKSTIDVEKSTIDSGNMPNQLWKSAQPIPYNKPYNYTDNQPTIPNSKTETPPSGLVVGSSSNKILPITSSSNLAIADLYSKPTQPTVNQKISSSISVVGCYEDRQSVGNAKILSSVLDNIPPPVPAAKATAVIPCKPNPTIPPHNGPYQTNKHSLNNANVNNPKPKIYKCLFNLGITEEDAIRITLEFPEELVLRVVTYCTRPAFVCKSATLDRPIFHFCKNPEQMVLTHEEIKAQEKEQKQLTADQTEHLIALRREKTKTLHWDLAKLIPEDPFAKSRCRQLSTLDGIEISSDRETTRIYYRESAFKEKLQHYLRKFGYPIPVLVGGLL